jgi:hypothetical protein
VSPRPYWKGYLKVSAPKKIKDLVVKSTQTCVLKPKGFFALCKIRRRAFPARPVRVPARVHVPALGAGNAPVTPWRAWRAHSFAPSRPKRTGGALSAVSGALPQIPGARLGLRADADLDGNPAS